MAVMPFQAALPIPLMIGLLVVAPASLFAGEKRDQRNAPSCKNDRELR
jgi:hypothetical protein